MSGNQMHPRRRQFLAWCGLLTLGSCGFQLRGAPEMAFSSIYVGGAESSSFGNELRRNLASLERMQVVTDAAQRSSAQVVLDIVSEQREKTVVGVNTTGQVREFQLRLRTRFRLRTPQGKELLAETELLQTRGISFNESAVLAKEAEEGQMYRDMQTDMIQQLMRRLAAVRTL